MSPGCPCPVSGHRDVPGMSPVLCRGTGMSPGCPCPVSGHRAVPGGSPVPSPCPRALTPVATPAVLRQPPGAVACPCPRLPPRCPSRERGRARWATSREKISREKQNKKNPGMAGSVSPDTSRPLPCATAVPPRPPGVPAQLRSCPSAASPQCHQCPNPGLSRRQSAPVSPDLPCQPRCVTKCHPRPPNPPCQPHPVPSHRDPKSIPPLPTKSIPPVPPKSPHLCPRIHPTLTPNPSHLCPQNPSHPYPKFTSPVPPNPSHLCPQIHPHPYLPNPSYLCPQIHPPVPPNPSHPYPKFTPPVPPKSIPPLPTKSIPPVPQNPSHPYPPNPSHLCPKIHPTLTPKSIPPVPQNPSHPCPKSFLPAPKSIPPIPPNPSPPPSPAGATLALCPRCVRHSRDTPGTGTGWQLPPQIPSQIPSQI
ncbi:uncharacterized protein LOC143694179 isoform X2 [Agelaius phoeniceus]|uniref:uncharacterized protein LOC143694179 isoform X2 n=1 Tax=Agelaius phoeniceus TaxID=39638 RepID=UPI004054A080